MNRLRERAARRPRADLLYVTSFWIVREDLYCSFQTISFFWGEQSRSRSRDYYCFSSRLTFHELGLRSQAARLAGRLAIR